MRSRERLDGRAGDAQVTAGSPEDAMCARFTLKTGAAELIDAFELAESPDELEPRYNVAPSQRVAVVPNLPGPRSVKLARWGLIPSWARDPKIAQKLVNARSETVAEKPSFRDALRFRRCLVLADGFYEWRKHGGGKMPMYIRLRGGEPFAMAGLWETWRDPKAPVQDALVHTCTLLTTTPNALMAPIHNRMPVILPREAWTTWLQPRDPGAELLLPLLQPYPAEAMRAVEVSPWVNSVRNDAPRCVEPVLKLL